MQADELIPLLDFTRLNEEDTPEEVAVFCDKAQTKRGNVAAVCLYSDYITLAKKHVPAPIKIATVANFPSGTQPLSAVLQSIENSLKQGADEIDVVINYQAYLAGDTAQVGQFVKACKQACGKHVLKVILETGVLQTKEHMDYVSRACIANGADFLKTSTGKIAVGTTLEAAEVMLKAIAEENSRVGFKASGGIKTVEQAFSYVSLAQQILPQRAVNSENFRIGASSLLEVILNSQTYYKRSPY